MRAAISHLVPRIARLLRAVGSARLVAWMVVLSIGLLTLPDVESAISFPDTRSYLKWPAPMLHLGVEIMGARAATYPLILDAVGIGPALVHLQWISSVFAWAFLGWTLARIPGCVLGALLALAPPLAAWNLAALTESFGISLLVLSVALSLELVRRPRGLTAVAWTVTLIPLAFIRDINLLLLPALLIPLLAHPSRRSAVLALIAMLTFGGALMAMNHEGRSRLYTYLAIWWRVNPSPEHREWFEARGMPSTRMANDDAKSIAEYHNWLADGGVWTYRHWALTRSTYYERTLAKFRQPDPSNRLVKKYFPEIGIPPGGLLSASGDRLYQLTAPPRTLWLLAILALPAVDFWRHRRCGALPVLAVTLGATTAVQGLVAFVSDFAEVNRHMLGAFVLYRVSFLVAGIAWLDVIRAPDSRPMLAWPGIWRISPRRSTRSALMTDSRP